MTKYEEKYKDIPKCPSVTGVIKSSGIIHLADDFYLTRGSNVHDLIMFYDQNDYDPLETQRFGLDGYVDGWAAFLRDAGSSLIFDEIEVPKYSKTYHFRGTPDRAGEYLGRSSIFDVKTGAEQKWHPIQLGGYEILLDKPCEKYDIYLPGNGKYRIKKWDDADYKKIFLSFLAVHNWKANNGYLKEK